MALALIGAAALPAFINVPFPASRLAQAEIRIDEINATTGILAVQIAAIQQQLSAAPPPSPPTPPPAPLIFNGATTKISLTNSECTDTTVFSGIYKCSDWMAFASYGQANGHHAGCCNDGVTGSGCLCHGNDGTNEWFEFDFGTEVRVDRMEWYDAQNRRGWPIYVFVHNGPAHTRGASDGAAATVLLPPSAFKDSATWDTTLTPETTCAFECGASSSEVGSCLGGTYAAGTFPAGTLTADCTNCYTNYGHYTLECGQPKVGRYVTVVASQAYLTAHEIEIYGARD